jgi:hypothetical protein
MSDFLEQINNSFSVKPIEAKGAIDLLRRLQLEMQNSGLDLNKEQITFVQTSVLVLAKNLGWLAKNPIILKDDSLRADETGLVLKRGSKQEKFSYELCFYEKHKQPKINKTKTRKIVVKEKDLSLELAKKLESQLRNRNMELFMTASDDSSLPLAKGIQISNKHNPNLKELALKIARSTIAREFLDTKLKSSNLVENHTSPNGVYL